MSIRTACVASVAFLSLVPFARGQSIDLSNPRNEAEYLALEVDGQLTPSIARADQIRADLAAIRLAHPKHSSARVFPSWIPGDTLVGMTPDAYAEYKAGTFTGFDSLYATLGTPAVATHDSNQWLHVRFGKMYHGVRLSELFDPIDGVRYAEPNGTIGDGNDIVARSNRTYSIIRGFGDCPAGCIYRETWDYTVTDNGVSPPPVPDGDFNDDGVVNSADFVLMRNGGSHFNDTHYNAWRNNFGGPPASGSGNSSALVPEPASGTLLILGLILVYVGASRSVAKDWRT